MFLLDIIFKLSYPFRKHGNLQLFLNELDTVAEETGLSINISGIKLIVFSRTNNRTGVLNLKDKPIQQVSKTEYLGCWITDNLDRDLEIKTRIETLSSHYSATVLQI